LASASKAKVSSARWTASKREELKPAVASRTPSRPSLPPCPPWPQLQWRQAQSPVTEPATLVVGRKS